MNFKCPKCKSNLFHVEKDGAKIIIKCYRPNKCGSKNEGGWETKAIEESSEETS